ncbi:MAG: aspartate aminotransferase family protein [Myxococcales bacterium]|nr:aspartate aminotransferase family protein [Myxococcota bacterium]MDW8282655.1 aspartate aminotransferase family protein [Myxococcales bacterium]
MERDHDGTQDPTPSQKHQPKRRLPVLTYLDSATVRHKHAEFLMPCTINYYAEPLVLRRGDGMYVEDADGKRYLDFFGGILTISLGHCHPEVVEAVSEQLRTLGHTSTLYPNEWIVRLAEELAALTPGRLQKSFFTSSGTEADEVAVMLARLYTGRQEIIALRYSYSGRGMYAISAMGHAPWRPIPPVMPGITHAPAPYCYRCPFGLRYPDCGVRCADDLEEVIATTTTGKPAAFIAEPILGVGGFITPPREYFQKAVAIVRRHGGIFICDEVQTGWGRTGTHWCGIEHYGVEPEIMTFAKGAASGLPIGITIATPEVADTFRGLTLSTFGGNPVSMTAALATLHVMRREDIPGRAARLGQRLRHGLEELMEKHPLIGEVRGLGLMQALELVEDRNSKVPATRRTGALMEAARRRGLLIGRGGLHGNVVRIAPPMLVSADEIEQALVILDESLQEAAA